MTGHFLRGDVSSCLLLFNEIMDKGFDPHSFLNGLSSHFRNLLVGKDAQTLMLLEVAAGIRDRYLKQSEDCTVAFLLRCIDITNQFDIEYRNSRNQRLHVELALIRLCQANTEALQAPAQSASPEKKNADLRSHLAERAGGTGKREEVPVPEVPSGKVNEPEPPFVGPAAKKTVSRIKTPLRSSTPSIRNILKGTREEEKMAEPKEAVHEPKEIQSRSLEPAEFTLHDLQTEWMAFASSIEQAKPRMAITLKNRKLNLSEKYTISVTFDNSDQLADFNREVKQNMIDFLRQQLHNYSIQVQANVLETVHEKMIYTPEEKYEYLKTKNPRLEDLKKTFNLDFE
jgi:DNA polymerase-3 subunit gamma/tau